MKRQKRRSRLEDLQVAARHAGFYIKTYSGDGWTRFRFFRSQELQAGEEESGYFGPRNAAFTAYGPKQAWAFLSGVSTPAH